MNCSTIFFANNIGSRGAFQISEFNSPSKYSLPESRTRVRNNSLLSKIALYNVQEGP